MKRYRDLKWGFFPPPFLSTQCRYKLQSVSQLLYGSCSFWRSFPLPPCLTCSASSLLGGPLLTCPVYVAACSRPAAQQLKLYTAQQQLNPFQFHLLAITLKAMHLGQSSLECKRLWITMMISLKLSSKALVARTVHDDLSIEEQCPVKLNVQYSIQLPWLSVY